MSMLASPLPFARALRHVLLLVAALALLAVGSAPAALSTDNLLEPEKAFRISTRALDEHTVEVRFEIADGYYMYRDRFKFETASGKLLADAELPAGVRKTDAFFGETETYRREVVIRVPLTAADVERGRVQLKVTSQGCSDSGVCYVPLERVVEVRLAGSASMSGPPSSARIRSWLAQAWFQAVLAALLIMAAVWLRALDPLPDDARGVMRFGKGLGVMALAAGVVLLAFALGARGLLVALGVGS